MLSRHECYELCVQSPRHVVSFLRAVHGHEPLLLWEDFCGTAAVSRRWIKEGTARGDRAVGVDLDQHVVEVARSWAEAELGAVERERLVLKVGDCRGDGGAVEGADVVFAGNFSVGYLHTRGELVRYLRVCAARCRRGSSGLGGGVLACDTYGGATAFATGGTLRKHPGRHGETVHYHWVHERCDPLTGMVENSVSFRVEKDGVVVAEWPMSFVYRWRLWSIAELREAMEEAGFAGTEVYADVNVAPGQVVEPVTDASALGADWVVVVVGRV